LPHCSIKIQDRVLTIQVPSQFFYEYLEDKYLDLIQQTLYREIGQGTILNYRILVETESNTAVEMRGEVKPYTPHDKRGEKKPPVKVPSPFDRVEPAQFDSQINSKYTFTNFFEGSSNRLARTAAEAVSMSPAKTAFNPPVHSMVPRVWARPISVTPSARVSWIVTPIRRCSTCRPTSLRCSTPMRGVSTTINDFINFYQSIDVLIIDDIQELSGLEKTQNTFFHIFNHLHQNNKQLVMTSDCAPMDMQGVEERLLTRFRWGLSTMLERPDKELRKKILQNKVLSDGLTLSRIT